MSSLEIASGESIGETELFDSMELLDEETGEDFPFYPITGEREVDFLAGVVELVEWMKRTKFIDGLE